MDRPVCGGKIVIDDSRGMMEPVCSVCNRVWGGNYLSGFWTGFEAGKNSVKNEKLNQINEKKVKS